MARSLRLAAVIAAAAVLGVVSAAARQSQAPATPPTGTGLVAGQLIDIDTGRGIGAGTVLIALRPEPGARPPAQPFGVTVDSQGRFVFGSLAAGGYMMDALASGYTAVSTTQQFELAAGERRTDFRLTFRKLSSISGTVRDETGAPVVGIEVLALRPTSIQGRPPVHQIATRTKTDDRGEYRLVSLRPGDYYLCACSREVIPFDGLLLTTLAMRPLDLLPLAGRAAVAGASTVAFETPLRTIPPTLYPGTTMMAQAERLTIGGGEARTGIDIAVTTAPGVRVSGRIIGAPSALHASFLRLYPEGDLPGSPGITQYPPMLVQADGRFDFGNIPPGTYRLDVNFRPGSRGGGPSGQALQFIGARGAALSPPPAPTRLGGPANPDTDPLWASHVISVGDTDVTDVIIALNRGFTVTGRIEFSGSAPAPQGNQLTRASAQLMSLESGIRQRTYPGRLQSDGTFSIGGVIPGQYAVIPGGVIGPWVSLKSVTAAGVDITDSLLTIDRDLDGVVITLSDVVEGEVTGQVRFEANDDPGMVYVRVFPTDRRYWQSPFAAARRYRSIRVLSDGSFSVSRVPAGEYFVATSTGTGSEWMAPGTLELLARTAERIRMPASGTVTVSLRR